MPFALFGTIFEYAKLRIYATRLPSWAVQCEAPAERARLPSQGLRAQSNFSEEGRGIAFIFFWAGVVIVIAALAAFATRSYRTLVRSFAEATPAVSGADGEADDGAELARGGTEAG